jgi:hypothetical protein
MNCKVYVTYLTTFTISSELVRLWREVVMVNLKVLFQHEPRKSE